MPCQADRQPAVSVLKEWVASDEQLRLCGLANKFILQKEEKEAKEDELNQSTDCISW